MRNCSTTGGPPVEAPTAISSRTAASLLGAAADIFLNTVVASKHLLEAISATGRAPSIKVVLVSSFGVYGVAGLPRGHLVDEATPLEPHPERRDLYSQASTRPASASPSWSFARGSSTARAARASRRASAWS